MTKARVKATGKIIEVELNHIGCTPVYMDKNGVIYKGLYDLDFDTEEESLPKDEPDYWEKLKHQYAGMVMQGMFANPAFKDINIKFVVLGAVGAAAELVNRLKEEGK